MFGLDADRFAIIPAAFAQRRGHPRSPSPIHAPSMASVTTVPADLAERIPRPGSPTAMAALNAINPRPHEGALEDHAVDLSGLYRNGETVAAAARRTRSMTPLRHRMGVRPSRRSLEPLDLRNTGNAVPVMLDLSQATELLRRSSSEMSGLSGMNPLEGHTPDRSILSSASTTRSTIGPAGGMGRRTLAASLRGSISGSINRSAAASPTFSPPHSPLAAKSPPKVRCPLGGSPSPRAWYIREGGARGSHTDYYEEPRVNVYMPTDRRAGKTVVFGQVSRALSLSSELICCNFSLTYRSTLRCQVVETPAELDERAQSMKFYRRETERRISKQQSMPHILERAKVREAKQANKRESLGEEIGRRLSRAQSPLRRPLDIPLMYGTGSPWVG